MTAGGINPVTRKRHLGDTYEPRTIRHPHSNAVIRSFYEFWIEDAGGGPLINPVQLSRRGARGRAAERAPQPAGAIPGRGEGPHNPKIPRRRPREMPEERWRDLFAGLRSNRDRAVLALAVSNGSPREDRALLA